MTTLTDHLLVKELFLRFTVGVFREHIINECVCVCVLLFLSVLRVVCGI